MEIREVTYQEVEEEYKNVKPDLLDRYATYFGCFIKNKLVGIVSYVEHDDVIYLCHAYINKKHRNKGVYKLLWNYRDSVLQNKDKPLYAHCNVDSLKYFINNGFGIEKALFKVTRK